MWFRMRFGKMAGVCLMLTLLGMLAVACARQATPPTPTAAPQPAQPTPTEAKAEKRTVTLRMILINSDRRRWDLTLPNAEKAVEAAHPDLDIQVDAQILPFGDRLTQLRAAATGRTPIDLVSLDQPEVGEFAAAGFTTDLTDWINRDLNGLADWYPPHREATKFKGRWHAIWAWTDARVLWYWKDLVAEAGVDPEKDMLTWDGYIESCQKLDEALADQNIEGCLLIGQPWIADWTFPYAWMNGGDIGVDVNADLAAKTGAKEAWVPTLDSEAWIKALQFTRRQVDAGIDPFTEHQFGTAFVARRFATWLGGTWVYGRVVESGADMSNLGLVAAFPVPSPDVQTATMAGGWTLAIPSTSQNPEIAWEFLKALLDRDNLGNMITQVGYLPTRADIAQAMEGGFRDYWNQGGEDRWSELQALLPYAYGRPSFPTWPQVASAITEMIQKVMFENADPAQAAQEGQRTVLVEVLGWPEGTQVSLHDDAGETCEHADVDRLIQAVTPWQKAADDNGNGKVCSHVTLP